MIVGILAIPVPAQSRLGTIFSRSPVEICNTDSTVALLTHPYI
jgi:hypothetical protein